MLAQKYNKSPAGVWSKNDSLIFNYSDSDEVENRLLQQVQQARDVTLASDELQSMIIDWPSEYHFSPLRANLLSSFQLEHFGNILEIGSGCGAITRFLGERCPNNSNIIALEGSERRAEITRARCRDLRNVTVCRDSFEFFEPDAHFDCITMIGVLEYSPLFFEDSDPVGAALKKAQDLLRPDGLLIIAIENQLGLKYFNGCSEDHSGRLFTGINNSYEPNSFKTFGRNQLQRIVEKAGFHEVEFFYPFPDYKLPRLLLRKDSVGHNMLDVSWLPGQYPSRDYSGNKERFFNEAETWALLVENGMMPDLVNSFLLFAGKGSLGINNLVDPWLAKTFSCPCKKKYLRETSFTEAGTEIVVEKKLSFLNNGTLQDEEESIHHCIGRQTYFSGVPYSTGFVKQVSGIDSYNKLVDYLRPWVDLLRKKSFLESEDNKSERLLISGELLGCLPANLIIGTNRQLHLCDQEWKYEKTLATGFILFRGIYREIGDNIFFLERTDLFTGEADTVFYVIKKIFAEFGFTLDTGMLKKFINTEVDIQKTVSIFNGSRQELQDNLYHFFTKTRLVKTSPGQFFQNGGTSLYAELQMENEINKTQTNSALEELATMKTCWSWKLGRIVTYIPRLLRG